MNNKQIVAPGSPGIPARWTSSKKDGIGTALSPNSRVWFTLSHGILNEIYYPGVDQACMRDWEFLVSDGSKFFSEEKRHTQSKIRMIDQGAPGYRIVNNCNLGRYRIEKEIITDPQRDVVLQSSQFKPLLGGMEDYHLFVLLAPHIGNQGAGNSAWIGDYKGVPMLFAQRENLALALASSAPWLKCSAGFVGFSDGWQDVSKHKYMAWEYERAPQGNVALIGEIDLITSRGQFTLSLGFGINPDEAGQRALASLQDGFDSAKKIFLKQWRSWQRSLIRPESISPSPENSLYRTSTAVLRTHEAKRFPGGLIASLSVPWGNSKGDDDLGGYHVVWPRDLVESAGGLLAAGAKEDVHRVLNYLQVTQEADGHWPQNMWLDGHSYWNSVQMDETALPLLLLSLAFREGVISQKDLKRYWPMIYKAASFLVVNGPVTQQDRWEEDPGYSPFTLATEISALVAAAEFSDRIGKPELGKYLLETADAWNANIERWIYVSNTDLAREVGVDGYYVRIAPVDQAEAGSPTGGYVPIKNRAPDQSSAPADLIVSPDALALVRFGLRAAEDPRILNTVKVIDSILKVETPFGPAWHRYNQDGYGEHENGEPFDGTGIGRAWPLLTGERAHYELAAGHNQIAEELLHTLEQFSNLGGLLPEQIWDSQDIPELELFFGQPSGSAIPLVWAHAEYVKLLRSIRDGQVFDTSPQTYQRYVLEQTKSMLTLWRSNAKTSSIEAGKTLRIETAEPSKVEWSIDEWKTINQVDTIPSGFGIHFIDIRPDQLSTGEVIRFRFSLQNDQEYALKIKTDSV